MAEQGLHRADIDAGLEQMGGEAVAQGVCGRQLRDPSGRNGVFDGALDGPRMHVVLWPLAGEEPVLGMKQQPPGAQQRQQRDGQGHEAVLLAFAAADVNHHALAVDVADLQRAGLGDPQPRRVGHREQHPIARPGNGSENGEHLGLRKDHRQPQRQLGVGDVADELLTLKHDAVEEAQR